MREYYNLFLTAIVAISAVALLGLRSTPTGALYALLGLVFLFINAFSLKLIFGIVAARVKDISHLVRAIMLPMMFLTPIFWLPEQMGELMKVLWWNPFYHYIEIFRGPLLTGEVPVESWIFVSVLWAAVSIVGFFLFARFRQRIVFWF